mgnify:CR=1 FL=1
MPHNFDDEELRTVMGGIDIYPITGNELVTRARGRGASEELLDFLQTIPPEQMLENDTDVISRAESESQKPG